MNALVDKTLTKQIVQSQVYKKTVFQMRYPQQIHLKSVPLLEIYFEKAKKDVFLNSHWHSYLRHSSMIWQ